MKNLIFLLLALSFLSCNQFRGQKIEFKVQPDKDSQILIKHKPIHYKYASQSIDTLLYRSGRKINYRNLNQVPEMITVQIGNSSSLLYADGNTSFDVIIDRRKPSRFLSTKNEKIQTQLNAYYKFVEKADSIEKKEKLDLIELKENGDTTYFRTLVDKIKLSENLLNETPYQSIIQRNQGDYLIKKMEYLKYYTTSKNRDEIRNNILSAALNGSFFTYESLLNQRAGSRDFTNAYAHSFNIAERLRKKYGEDLQIYDINRIAFDELQKKRNYIVDRIEDLNAKAYTEMHIVLEGLGEGNFEKAEKMMLQYSQTYIDEYPEFVNVVLDYYNGIKKLQRGSTAISFSFPDKDGKVWNLDDFKGKMLVLDFWASWCSPCLQEFPYLQKLEKKFAKEVHFVGISLDEEKSVWENSLSKYELGDYQLYGGLEFENPIFKKYKAGGIPFMLLIDADGKILRNNDIRASYNLDSVIVHELNIQSK